MSILNQKASKSMTSSDNLLHISHYTLDSFLRILGIKIKSGQTKLVEILKNISSLFLAILLTLVPDLWLYGSIQQCNRLIFSWQFSLFPDHLGGHFQKNKKLNYIWKACPEILSSKTKLFMTWSILFWAFRNLFHCQE